MGKITSDVKKKMGYNPVMSDLTINKERFRAAMKRGGWSMKTLSLAAGMGETFVRDMLERGSNSKISSLKHVASILGVSVGYLINEESGSSPIVGRIGADTSGEIIYGNGDGGFGDVITPPGAGPDSVAVEVLGYSMGTFVDGALIFYSDVKGAPTDEMLGDMVVVGLEDGRALLKKLMRGSQPGLYDLESVNGPIMRDQRVVWAADIEAIVPPRQARRIKL